MIMTPTKLTTVEDITAAINTLVEQRLSRPYGHQTKPEQQRAEAARFADLFEMRAAQWHELGVRAFRVKGIDDVYGSACAVAEKHDRDQVRYWRKQAGAR